MAGAFLALDLAGDFFGVALLDDLALDDLREADDAFVGFLLFEAFADELLTDELLADELFDDDALATDFLADDVFALARLTVTFLAGGCFALALRVGATRFGVPRTRSVCPARTFVPRSPLSDLRRADVTP